MLLAQYAAWGKPSTDHWGDAFDNWGTDKPMAEWGSLTLEAGRVVGLSFNGPHSASALQVWFDKRRGLATGLAMSGSGVGNLVMALALQALMDDAESEHGAGCTDRAHRPRVPSTSQGDGCKHEEHVGEHDQVSRMPHCRRGWR